jgi:hypothetical protein
MERAACFGTDAAANPIGANTLPGQKGERGVTAADAGRVAAADDAAPPAPFGVSKRLVAVRRNIADDERLILFTKT